MIIRTSCRRLRKRGRSKPHRAAELWYRLKNVKTRLKRLHFKEFTKVKDKIEKWEENLAIIQTQMQKNPMNDDLHQKEREREAIIQARKWRNIESMTLL